MINLVNGDSIVIKLGGAVAATQPQYIASYGDQSADAFAPGGSKGALNSTTEVTAIATPDAGTVRMVKEIVVTNRDSADVDVYVSIANGANRYYLADGVTVPAGNTLYLNDSMYVTPLSQGQAGATGSKGDKGDTGDAGATGATGSAGADGADGQGFTWQGAWGSGTPYVAYDVVSYEGSSYNCILDITGTDTPDVDTTHWAVIAEKGEQGEQGIQGIQGETGTGAPGSIWYHGEGAPGTTHADGDYYLNTSNGDVYVQASSAWGSPIFNIEGEAGAAGSDGQGLNFLGAWVSGTSYAAYDLVSYEDSGATSTYICTSAVSGTTAPPSDTSHWSVFVTGSAGSGAIEDGVTETDISGLLWGNGSLVSQATMLSLFGQSKYNPRRIVKQMLDSILQGTLDTGNATPASVTRTFGSAGNAGGIGTWTGAWGDSTTYRTITGAGSVTFVIRTDGTNDIVFHRVGAATGTISVTLDSAAQTNWAQSSAEAYTLSGVAAGVHTIVLSIAAGTFALGSAVYYQLPYQGVGVAGDVAEVIWAPDWFYATSVAITNTVGAATYASTRMGEAITHRLPICSAVTDANFTRASCAPAALTVGNGETGLVKYYCMAGNTATFYDFGEGMAITLSASGSPVRGKAFTADLNYCTWGINLASSIYHMNFVPCLVKITTAGSGSAFSVGDVALLICTDTATGASAFNAQVILANTATRGAADLYKLPSSLL